MAGPYTPEFQMCAPTRVGAEAIWNSLLSINDILNFLLSNYLVVFKGVRVFISLIE